MRIKSNNSGFGEFLAAEQVIHIYNDLCGNDTCSVHELVKGFPRPLFPGTLPKIVPEDLVTARQTLTAKRKLNLILKSKSTSVAPVQIGDLVQVYTKLQHEKRGKWSNPKLVLSFGKISGTVTVPGRNGKKSQLLLKIFALLSLKMSLLYNTKKPMISWTQLSMNPLIQ